MRIGINALYLLPGKVGGTESYLRQLLHWMPRIAPQHEFLLLANEECMDAGLATDSCVQLIPTKVRATSRPHRLLFEQFSLPGAVRRLGIDVLFNPGFTAPARCHCPMVTTFHDLQHKRHPEYFRVFDLPAWRLFLGIAARSSQRILAISHTTAADFRRFYPGVNVTVDVTPLGAGDEYFAIGEERESTTETEDVLLCVSTLHPHKNLDRLVRAFCAWRQASGASSTLVIAGMRGFYARQLDKVIEECDAGSFVRLTGWISQEELYQLYRTARAFIFPSLFEGFGIPPMEALACGIPTAVSNVEPICSNVGDGALRFDALNEGAIAQAIGMLMQDEALRKDLRIRARKQAQQFRWEGTARLTLASLEAAVQQDTP
jgi:glycosyltransferase involved in cell wall biosynthesis